jgi:hypothetical protein
MLPRSYQGFKIDNVFLSPHDAQIYLGYGLEVPRPILILLPDRQPDPSGAVISYIDILSSYFPMKEYLAFREGLMREQTQPRQQRPEVQPAP